jgi:hypothetical protein
MLLSAFSFALIILQYIRKTSQICL